MISKDFTYAVVGASDNQQKYGFKVFESFLNSGYKVIPVNINEKIILGQKSYKNLSYIKEKIDVVITVVPPKVTLEVLKEALSLRIKNIWMQPGSESDETIDFCQKNGISYISNACIMVQKDLKEGKSSKE